MRINFGKEADFGINKPTAFVMILIFIALSSVSTANAHTVSPDTFVRVVSANPDSRTYTFSCRVDPENGFLRDWFIRPDNGDTADDPNEAAILDKKSGEFVTYTFSQNSVYHIGCYIWNPFGNGNPANDFRGDMHIDLRQNTNSWNPQIVPISGNGLTATYECRYSSSDYSASWEVINAQTHQRSSIGNGKQISHTVPGHGLFDYICHVTDNTNGIKKSTGLPVEYFDQGAPYFPDKNGVPDGIKNVWNRDGAATQPTCTPAAETCDGKDNDCDNLVDENNVCNSTPPAANTSSSCFSNVQSISATCEGTISSDSMQGGCRIINCNSGSNSMQIKACDKPDNNAPQYFEMYRQTFVNSPLKVCIGSSCMKNEGYVKSGNYPVCISAIQQNTTQPPACAPTAETCNSKDDDCDGLIDEDNSCSTPPANTTSSQVCFSSVKDIPASCTGGSIVQDSYNGCRTLICSNGGNFLRVLVCNKPDGSIPQFFEMYRQAFAGSIPKICIGSYCIQLNGYAKSNSYPVCVDKTLYKEDFNDGMAQGWELISGFAQPSIYSTKVNNGIYTANVSSGNLGIAFQGISLPDKYTATVKMRLAARIPAGTSDQGLIFVNLKEYPNGASNQQFLLAGWRQNQNDDFFLTGAGTAYNLGHVTSPFSFDEGQWHTIKIVKSGTNFKLFINGILGLDQTLPIAINGGTIGLQLSQGIFEIDDIAIEI